MATRIEAFCNPDVLAWARDMAGLDEVDAARKVGVKPEQLKAWEGGRRRPTVTQLRKLAEVYKRPLAIFFLERVPADDPVPLDFRRLDPRAAEPLSPALRLAIREASVRRDAALELFHELDEVAPQFRLSSVLCEDPEETGERLRNALLAGRTPPGGSPREAFNFWSASAEAAGVLVFQAEGVDVEEMRGFSISERPLPAVVLNIKDAPAARSFSLFHELTHVLLNRGGLCIFEEDGPQNEFQRTEVFCNHVAGAALLPAALLLGWPEVPRRRVSHIPDADIVELSRRSGASREAVLRRLVILNRVTPAFYQRKRQEYARESERRSRPAREGGYAPPDVMAVATGGRLFTRLVLQAYDDERITSSDVAEYLGVRLKHLERIRARVRQRAGAGEPL